jgi:hypothetical protein
MRSTRHQTAKSPNEIFFVVLLVETTERRWIWQTKLPNTSLWLILTCLGAYPWYHSITKASVKQKRSLEDMMNDGENYRMHASRITADSLNIITVRGKNDSKRDRTDPFDIGNTGHSFAVSAEELLLLR